MKRTRGALAIAALLLAWRWWPAPGPAPVVLPMLLAPVATAQTPAAVVPAEAIAVRRGRLIRRLTVEPSRPCRGDDVTVQVELRRGAGDAKVAVAGRAGSTAVMRFAEAGRRSVSVVARSWDDRMQTRRVWIPVADCDARTAALTVRPVDADRVGFAVTLPDGFGPATRYRWEFGDGATNETVRPTTLHDYAGRERSRPTSSFVARVTVLDAAGRTIAARSAVTLSNAEWLASRGGTHWLPTRAERFVPPATAPGAPRRATLQVRDDGGRPTLERADLRGFACADLERSLPASLPATALSRTTLRATRWTDVELAIPADLWPEPVCRAEVRLHGRTAEGAPAVALAAVELDVATVRRRVTDPALIAQLRAARRQLGRGQISAEDLRLLAARRE